MRAAGETGWSAEAVLEHLRREHGYPFASVTSFLRWARQAHPDLYMRGVAR